MRALILFCLLFPIAVVAQQDTDAGPSVVHSSITPSDSATLTNPNNGALLCRAVYVGGAGNISITDVNNVTVTWTAVPAGSVIPFGPRKVNSTGTTATALVCLGR